MSYLTRQSINFFIIQSLNFRAEFTSKTLKSRLTESGEWEAPARERINPNNNMKLHEKDLCRTFVHLTVSILNAKSDNHSQNSRFFSSCDRLTNFTIFSLWSTEEFCRGFPAADWGNSWLFPQNRSMNFETFSQRPTDAFRKRLVNFAVSS